MLEKLDDVVFSNDDVVFVNADFDNVTLSSDDMGLINVNDGVNLDSDDPETINHVGLMAWCNRCKQHKACKKEINKKFMSVA